jgi:hypothetical protein
LVLSSIWKSASHCVVHNSFDEWAKSGPHW